VSGGFGWTTPATLSLGAWAWAAALNVISSAAIGATILMIGLH
jgi:hypothetical protein